MRRIAIIGSAGSGKSTLARHVGEALGIGVIHLDSLFWNEGWVRTEPDAFRETLQQVVQGPSWVIDGNYSETLDIRLQAADTVIFLDLPRTLCLWRALKRRFMYRNCTRPDMAPGCPEKMDLEFARWIWNYPNRSRPNVLNRLRLLGSEQRVIVLRSTGDVRRFLKKLRGKNG